MALRLRRRQSLVTPIDWKLLEYLEDLALADESPILGDAY
jgi:hypothetical protein